MPGWMGRWFQPSHSYVSCSEPGIIIIYYLCCGSIRKPRSQTRVTLLSALYKSDADIPKSTQSKQKKTGSG